MPLTSIFSTLDQCKLEEVGLEGLLGPRNIEIFRNTKLGLPALCASKVSQQELHSRRGIYKGSEEAIMSAGYTAIRATNLVLNYFDEASVIFFHMELDSLGFMNGAFK